MYKKFYKNIDFNTECSFHNVEVSTIGKHLDKLQRNIRQLVKAMLPLKVLNIGRDVLACTISFLVNACFNLSSLPNSLFIR